MSRIKTRAFDAAEYLKTPEEYLKTPEDVVLFLDEAFLGAREDNDPGLIAHALGVVARSKGMTAIAEQTGRSRESLYRAFSADGNPTLSTLIGVLETLGLRLTVVPVERGLPERAVSK
jgi:probable addiction module antidote protein